MKMKRTTAVFLVLSMCLCLLGCGKDTGGRLTIEDVQSLAAKRGEELTWSDFESYTSTEAGSGLYILVYEIDADYRLMIGGTPGEKPMYIYLISTGEAEQRIDVRYENIAEFLERGK